MRARQDQIIDAQEGTCTWIFDDENFQEWAQGSETMLWIKGNPGTGKSTLMSFLCQYLRDEFSADDCIILSFYFSARAGDIERSINGMLRTILYQICTVTPSICVQVREYLIGKGAISPGITERPFWHRKDLESAILYVLSTLSDVNIFLLVDALDEAQSEDIKLLTSFLQRLRTPRRQHGNTNPHYLEPRICLFCRHRPIVKRIPGREIHLEEHNRADVANYLEENLQLDRFPEAEGLYRDAWADIVDGLVQVASDSFQWASLVIESAHRYCGEGYSPAVLRKKLVELPKELDELYIHVLKNSIDPQNYSNALMLFQWICLGERPMSVEELRYAMVIEESALSKHRLRCEEIENFSTDDQSMRKKIATYSGGLLKVVENTYGERESVQVIHQSVQDCMLKTGLVFLASTTSFFREENLVTRGARSEGANELVLHALQDTPDINLVASASHYRIFMACMCYLICEEIFDEESGQEWYLRRPSLSEQEALSQYPFIVYAATCMFKHASKAQIFQTATQWHWERAVESLDLVIDDWIKSFRLIDGDSDECPEENSTLLQMAARHNLTYITNALLNTDNCWINRTDSKGCTALHHAAKAGHQDIVRLLLENKANPHIHNGRRRTPIIEAIGTEECGGVKCHSVGPPIDSSTVPAYASTTAGHISTIKMLLEAGVDISYGASTSGNALQEAARHGYRYVVELLMKKGADVNAISGADGTALIAASRHGREDVVRYLIKKGANVHIQAGRYFTALSAATLSCHLNIVSILLKAGAEVYIAGEIKSPICLAGTRSKASMFIDFWARCDNEDEKPKIASDALSSASEYDNSDLLDFILSPPVFNKLAAGSLERALYHASIAGHTHVLQRLLDLGASVDAHEVQKVDSNDLFSNYNLEDFRNPLLGAIKYGHFNCVKLLISRGVNVTVHTGILLLTMYSRMIYRDELEMCVGLLLAAGADVNFTTKRGNTALERARFEKLDGVVKLLEDAGARS